MPDQLPERQVAGQPRDVHAESVDRLGGCSATKRRLRARFTRFDDRFRGCDGDEWLERLFADRRWLEGIAYFPAGRYVVFSDIPNDRLLRWDELTATVGVFREPSGFANGNLADRYGRLVTCEQGNRRITRTEPDGAVTVLSDRWAGQQFNSPDVVIEHPDGSLWAHPNRGCSRGLKPPVSSSDLAM